MRIAAALALSSLLALRASAASFVVTTTSPSGAGSLRQAMLDANASGEGSPIEFDLSGKPPFTIDVDAPLPVMTVPVYILATTQPGFAGQPITTIASHVPGPLLDLRGGDSGVAGLRFVLTTGDGIVMRGWNDRVLLSVFDRAGAPSPSEGAAVLLHNTIHSWIAYDTFAYGTGLLVDGAEELSVEGNSFRGTQSTAIDVRRSLNVVIGEGWEGNTISDILTDVPAIAVDRASWFVVISDNTIAKVYAGIDIAGSKNLVSGNVIHDTKGWAVHVDGGTYNQLEHMETYDLGAQTANGIVLVNGGNHQLAPPRLTDVTITPEVATIAGTLPVDGTAEFFYSDSCGTPAGRFLIGDYRGLAGPFTVDTQPIPPGSFVTAQLTTDGTAGDLQVHETSAYSACVVARGSAAMPAPVIESLSQSVGDPTGGEWVQIRGSGFSQRARVYFGPSEARVVNWTGDVAVIAPPGSGTVDVIVRNPDGQQAVLPASFHYVHMCPGFFINQFSADRGVAPGGSATFKVVASSEHGPVTYQWSMVTRDGLVPIAGATGSSVTVHPTETTYYTVTLTNGCGSTVTLERIPVVYCTAALVPVITTQPDDVITPDGAAHLCLGYRGVVDSIIWYKGEPGDTRHPLEYGGTCVDVHLTGNTRVWARVSGACGSADSRAVTIQVLGQRRHLAGR